MSHWLAYQMGDITLQQARELELQKRRDPAGYKRREKQLGADRKSLEKRYGKTLLEHVEHLQESGLRPIWRTNRKTGKVFRK